MSSQFTTVRQVAEAVAREINIIDWKPNYSTDFPKRRTDPVGGWRTPTLGMSCDARQGVPRTYSVLLPDGRRFSGTKAQLLEWAALHLQRTGEKA